MEHKLQDFQLTSAELNLQKMNGLFVNEGYRCSAAQLTKINVLAHQINKILEDRSNDIEEGKK